MAPPISASRSVVIFLLSNIYLIAAPFVQVPADDGQNIFEALPYWIHYVLGFGVIFVGGVRPLIWVVTLSKIGGYELMRETVVGRIDRWERSVFDKRPIGSGRTESGGSVPELACCT